MVDKQPAIQLSLPALRRLQEMGFEYVQIKGYKLDRPNEYGEWNFYTLLPLKEIPNRPQPKTLFAPLDSLLLLGWASAHPDGAVVFLDPATPL